MPLHARYPIFLAFVSCLLAMSGAVCATDIKRETQPAEEAYYLGRPLHYWVLMVNDDCPKARALALKALATIGSQAAEAIPALIERQFHEENICVRKEILEVLGIIGTKTALPPLLDAVKDKDKDYRVCAIRALCNVGIPDNAVASVLAQGLLDKDGDDIREAALNGLKRMGPNAIKATIPHLLQAMKYRVGGGKSIGIIWPTGPMERGRMYELKSMTVPSFSEHAIASLVVLGPDAVPALAGIVKDGEYDTGSRAEAAQALGMIGPAAQSAVPVLVDLLKDKQAWPGARKIAVDSLGAIGPGAREAVPALREALRDDSKEAPLGGGKVLRERAKTALEKICKR